MPIYRGTQKVTPHRAGDDLARVYRGSHLVWEAVITVTPQAPTFHNAAPWVTLPTQQGVTYTVSGTPGYSQTVTIAATPQAGYELVGNSSWTHTFPSMYPLNASWGPVYIQRFYVGEVTSHTIVESGSFTFSCPVQPNVASIRLFVNGTQVKSTSQYEALSYSQPMSLGDNVSLRLYSTNASYGHTGSWSIVKN